MSDEILKGNFNVKKPVREKREEEKSVVSGYKEKALASIGGSMVYVERTNLTWDGEEKENK